MKHQARSSRPLPARSAAARSVASNGTAAFVGNGSRAHIHRDLAHAVNHSLGAATQRRLREAIQQSPQVTALRMLIGGIGSSPRAVAERRPQTSASQPARRDVVQTFPPGSVEEASARIQELEALLLGKGVVLGYDFHGHRQVALDSLGLAQIASLFSTYSGLVVDFPGRTGKSPEEVLAALQELAETRKWRTAQQSHTFGYGAVPSVHQPPPGPFQEHYSFLPFAPQLHGLPFFQPPQGQTAEWLGQDLMVRHRSPEDLQSLRDQSGAYRGPAQRPSAPDQPSYPPDVYGEHQSTVVDRGRVLDWSTEKRDGTTPARHGPAVGRPWPDQGRVMGSSAQEAVMAAVREGARDLDTRRSYDWLHLYAFSIGGLDRQNPQVPQNLVVGSQQANFYHLIFESVVKELANDHGLTVLVRVTPTDPISPRWHIYRRLVYSLSIVVRVPGSFEHPEGMLVAQRTITRAIDCLGLPPVHTNDAETIRHSLLAELGILTPEYRAAVERALPLASDRERPSHGPAQLPRFMHRDQEARMVDRLLRQNNCLINAVARGLVNRNATFEELVTIRGMMIERGIELGQMLFASPAVLEIIRRVFFSARGIRVVYRNGQPDDVVNGPDPIIIDHELLHFELRK